VPITDPQERADFDAWLCRLRDLLTGLGEIDCPVVERFIRQQNLRLKEMWEAGHDPWEVYADVGKRLGEHSHDFIVKKDKASRRIKSDKTCDHCGTSAKRRYAVRIKGRPGISMVGSSCAKKFPRANQSDLIRSLAKPKVKSESKRGQQGRGRRASRYLAEVLGLGYAVMPPRMTQREFEKEFEGFTVDPSDPNKPVLINPLARIRDDIYELYKWKGFGVIVYASALDKKIDPSVRITLYDPYSGIKIESRLGYVHGPLGSVVSQASSKNKRVQEWLDAFPKWDPIAEHVTKIPATQWPATIPPPVRDSGGVFDDGMDDEKRAAVGDFRDMLKRTYPNFFGHIYLGGMRGGKRGSYGLSIQAGRGIMSEPGIDYEDPYDFESFEIAIWKIPFGSATFMIHPSKIYGFPPDLLNLWSLGESVAGYVSIDNVQLIYEYLASLAAREP